MCFKEDKRATYGGDFLDGGQELRDGFVVASHRVDHLVADGTDRQQDGLTQHRRVTLQRRRFFEQRLHTHTDTQPSRVQNIAPSNSSVPKLDQLLQTGSDASLPF